MLPKTQTNLFLICWTFTLFHLAIFVWIGHCVSVQSKFLRNSLVAQVFLCVYRCWGCCSLHHEIWWGHQLPGIHKLQGHLQRCRDDAGERPVGVMPGKAHQQLPPPLHQERRCTLWGQVHVQQTVRELAQRQDIPIQACQCSSVL